MYVSRVSQDRGAARHVVQVRSMSTGPMSDSCCICHLANLLSSFVSVSISSVVNRITANGLHLLKVSRH